jgi:hypothetical protein
MPQPFKRRPGQEVTIFAGAPLMRPGLAILIANVASHWSKLEQTISLWYATLLSGQEPSALASYHSVFDITLRHTQFKAAAKSKGVSQDLIDESDQFHAKVKKTATRRNKVVHGIWAICIDRPNTLLLCEPDAVNKSLDQFLHDMHERIDTISRRMTTPVEKVDPFVFDVMNVDEFMEYGENDFNDICKAIISLEAGALEFFMKISNFSVLHERSRRGRPR